MRRLDREARRMPLDLQEIEYIIVKDDEDLAAFFASLEELTKGRKSLNNHLLSKVLTAKQIKKDF